MTTFELRRVLFGRKEKGVRIGARGGARANQCRGGKNVRSFTSTTKRKETLRGKKKHGKTVRQKSSNNTRSEDREKMCVSAKYMQLVC